MRFSTLLCCGVLIALMAGDASAGFVTAFTGNTQMSESANSDGIVNFAVYDNTDGGDWTTEIPSLGAVSTITSGGAIDTTAKFVFFYQVVNTDPNTGGTDPDLATFKIASNGVAYSSAGFLSDKVFFDGTANVGPSGNLFLGTEGTPHKTDDVVDGAPSESGVAAPTFATLAAAVNPEQVIGGLGGVGGFATLQWGAFGEGVIGTGAFSSVVFLTSNNPPVGYGRGNIRDGDPASDGDIPVHAPEPGSLLVWAGVLGIGAVLVLRRRKTPAAKAVSS
ncbi:MAG: hypothetical protein HYS13_12485 [Planctomycetia bacterium]|nr:hypothetical protein [Planctomycetia bacterium]